jgi:hypothetical protein
MVHPEFQALNDSVVLSLFDVVSSLVAVPTF